VPKNRFGLSLSCRRTVTVRDLLAWVDFICTTVRPVSAEASQCLELDAAYVHGACIVLVDCLSSPGMKHRVSFQCFLVLELHAATGKKRLLMANI
jgi:hypothetical protein